VALFLRVSLVAATAAPHAQKGPYLTGLSSTSIEIRVELATPAPASAQVRREGEAEAKSARFDDPAEETMHVIRATGLSPGTGYVYVVTSGKVILGGGRFATAPGPGSVAPITFLAYGDDRTDPTAHAVVVQAMQQVAADFLVNTGDAVQDGAEAADWQSFFDVEGPMLRNRAIFSAIGNHELTNDQSGANFARYLALLDDAGVPHLYGTARFGSVRLFFLNGMHDFANGQEREWLERELAASDTEAGLIWRVAVVHHGPWSVGPHGPNRLLVEAGVPQLLAKHSVDLILSGHDHVYDRGADGRLKYIVTGGGGAPLYGIGRADPTMRKAEAAYHFVELSATAQSMSVVVHRAVDNSVLERCAFNKGQPWDCDPPPSPQVSAPAASPPSSTPARCACSTPGLPPSGTSAAGGALLMCLIGRMRRRSGGGRRLPAPATSAR
jgi:hypothetical protein